MVNSPETQVKQDLVESTIIDVGETGAYTNYSTKSNPLNAINYLTECLDKQKRCSLARTCQLAWSRSDQDIS